MCAAKTILVIDSDRKFSLDLVSVLIREGFRAQHVANGADGLSAVRSLKPDMILCDIMMPPPDGFGIKKELAKDPELESIPFIFLSAKNTQWDKLIGLGIGADDYITKPFDMNELLARIQSVLRRDERGHQRALKEGKLSQEKLKSSIPENLGHEMRSPLANIDSTLGLILSEKLSRNDNQLVEFVGIINNNAHRLKFLVEDLEMLRELDYGKLTSDVQRIDIDFNLKNPINQILKMWEKKQLEVRLAIDATTVVYAPRDKFSHIVEHLVDNACKFSPAKGKITIELKPQVVGGCSFEVSNQGFGIPADLREKVFERYFQISQGDKREFGGFGVGLTLARAFARAWGGDVTVGQVASVFGVNRVMARALEAPLHVTDDQPGCLVRLILPPHKKE